MKYEVKHLINVLRSTFLLVENLFSCKILFVLVLLCFTQNILSNQVLKFKQHFLNFNQV